ncbi:MAG: ABC transporter substrate-binding protein [Magnetovibrionaceae bacterium]
MKHFFPELPRFLTRHLLSALLALVFATSAPLGAKADSVALGQVEQFHQVLLDIMQNAESLGTQGRFDRVAPAVRETFALERMVRIASGSAWRESDAETKAELVKAFHRMTAATYASQFKGHDGETFETTGTRPGPRGTTLIDTQLNVPESSRTVPLVYVTLSKGKQGRIVDVLLDGDISQLAVRRSEYQRIVDQGGATALIAELNGMADKLLAD